jgi:uncharacterized membrane protein HdeD (DUF308 family)
MAGKTSSSLGEIVTGDPSQLVHNWPLLVVRGVAAIVFGVVAFGAPTLSLSVLVFLFGAYALADGVLAMASAIRGARASGGPRCCSRGWRES